MGKNNYQATRRAMKTYLKVKNLSYEYRDVWVDNNDEAVEKRVRWYTSRGWQIVGTRITSNSPDRIYIQVRRAR